MRQAKIEEQDFTIDQLDTDYMLSEGWATGTLKDLIGHGGILIDGDWIESKDQDPNGDIRLIQLADIGDGIYKNKSSRFLTLEKAKELACTFLKPGDVLIARMPEPLGRACIFPGDPKPAVTAVDICIVRTGEDGGNHKWIMYIINSPAVRRRIEALQRGTTRKRISRRNLVSLILPIPPLNEQNRIVAKVEELLVRVNTIKDRLAKVSLILKRFRQAVLAAACSGRLTANWREQGPKVTPVDYSIQDILRHREVEWLRTNGSSKKYKPPQDVKDNELQELPEGWKYISSDTLFSFVTSGSRGWAKYYAKSGSIFIRVGNLDHDTISLDLSDVQHVNPAAGQEGDRTRIQLGDILISITADVGMIALVQDEIGEAYVNQHVAIARPAANVFRPYLAWYLASREGGQIQFQDLQRGATKVGLGLDDIRSVAIPFAPIEEQQEIVRRVDAMFKLAEAVEKRVAAATARAEKLTQAILAKAFRGELVPTEAELARREGRSYETASELLARIKSERESNGSLKTALPKNSKHN